MLITELNKDVSNTDAEGQDYISRGYRLVNISDKHLKVRGLIVYKTYPTRFTMDLCNLKALPLYSGVNIIKESTLMHEIEQM